jgi:two-component system phosphate regulon sensor histidine kinase PhoR
MSTFSIRSSTIRLGIFISTLVIAVILVFQLIWLKRVYLYEQKEFDLSVIKSIKGMYEDINASAYYSTHMNNLIQNPEPHLYLANINLPVNTDSLTANLHYELEDFGIFTDCHIGIYSADSGKYIYTGILESAGRKQKKDIILPDPSGGKDHLALNFPNRRQYILAQMDFWIISSAFLLIVLILFSASLYFFYRQKFKNEIQKDFIHNFTHEFKTPVSVISLAADVLKTPGIADKPEKLNTYANIVGYQSNYLHSQIEKLLQFAHAESRQLHLDKKRTNIHELIKEAVSHLAPLIDERKSEVKLALEATNPWLEADREYLVIVITNLVDNAIKYSKHPVIIIHTTSSDNSITLSVQDNGIGIEKHQINLIFEKFFRVRQGETYAAKGFGIGLSFVKKIISAHNGKISIESIPNKGSNFTIELPHQ